MLYSQVISVCVRKLVFFFDKFTVIDYLLNSTTEIGFMTVIRRCNVSCYMVSLTRQFEMVDLGSSIFDIISDFFEFGKIGCI